MTTSYPEAFAKFRASTKAAVEFQDPNWTNSAITRERIKRLQTARDELRRTTPPANNAGAADRTAKNAILGKLRPTDADTVAVTANEWAKLSKLLDSGRPVEGLLANASQSQLAAILDQLPTQFALEADDSVARTLELEDRIVDRLVDLGDPDALTYATAVEAAAYDTAWGQVLNETLTDGTASVGALSALHRVAPNEFAATQEEDTFGATIRANTVRNLDAIATREAATSGA
jgi:hypothetical protein